MMLYSFILSRLFLHSNLSILVAVIQITLTVTITAHLYFYDFLKSYFKRNLHGLSKKKTVHKP